MEVGNEPHQTVQKGPSLDHTDGISPDIEVTISIVKMTILNLPMNMITCDSNEIVEEVLQAL